VGGLIKQSWLVSGGVYGYRKITYDLRDLVERCGKHRVYRLMNWDGLVISTHGLLRRMLSRIEWFRPGSRVFSAYSQWQVNVVPIARVHKPLP
jgi:transposase InsO family protein